MTMTAIGDLAASLTFLRNSTSLKQTISTLTTELSTGTVADIHGRLGGNYAYLSEIDSSLITLAGHATAAAEAGTIATSMQASLSMVYDRSSELAQTLMTTDLNAAHATQNIGSVHAREDLGTMVSALNTSVAGRALFSGSAVGTVPLADSAALLDGLRTELAGLTDPADIRTAATAWFGSGGGFDTDIYQGSTQDLAPMRLGDGQSADLMLRADDPVFKSLLMETALAALADDPALGLSEADANTLRFETGTNLLAVKDQVIELQGKLGLQEMRIEEAQTALSVQRLVLEETRGQLLAADPFETAAYLEDAQFRLDALFAVAARSASLKLVNYL